MNNVSNVPVNLSAIDEKRFGIPTARAFQVTVENLQPILDFCRTHQVQLLIARCSTEDIHVAQEMEKNGFRLMDTLVYYRRNLSIPYPDVMDAETVVRPFQAGEEEIITKIAQKAFKGYRGHYHADPRLPMNLCDDTYADWALQSCVNQLAEEVLVAEHKHEIKGFLTLRIPKKEEGEGVLFGVSPEAQGTGVGRSLMIGAMRWFQNRGASSMLISTQIVNLSSQKVWMRLGFELNFAKYTFHKWFDEESSHTGK